MAAYLHNSIIFDNDDNDAERKNNNDIMTYMTTQQDIKTQKCNNILFAP